METMLYNIFKTKNATNLAKPILKSPYKALLEAIGNFIWDLKTACVWFFYGPLISYF